MEQTRGRVKRSSNGEWRSSCDVAAGDEERGKGDPKYKHEEKGDHGNHQKHKHDDKEKKGDGKEKKKKTEVDSISILKKLNEELKEKMRKRARAADKMAEEYSKLRGKLRKCKRERESLEAEIETLKQRNEDLAKIVGNFGNHEDPLLNKDLMPESAEAGELAATANEPNSTSRDRHHQQSLMAEVQKLKVSMKRLFGDAAVNGAPKTSTAGPAIKKPVVVKEDVKGSSGIMKKEERKEVIKDHAQGLKKEEPTVQCKKCGKAVKQKSLIHHDRAVHLNQTRFDCDMCPYKCYFSSSLKEHKKGHDRKEGTYRSKFSCHLCTFSTPVSGSFAKHMKGHETDAKLPKKQPSGQNEQEQKASATPEVERSSKELKNVNINRSY